MLKSAKTLIVVTSSNVSKPDVPQILSSSYTVNMLDTSKLSNTTVVLISNSSEVSNSVDAVNPQASKIDGSSTLVDSSYITDSSNLGQISISVDVVKPDLAKVSISADSLEILKPSDIG